METEQAKIYHHHTPRRYLLPWADADERIAWYGYGKVARSGLTVVGGENDFYKLKELTVPDIDCLKLVIDGLSWSLCSVPENESRKGAGLQKRERPIR